MDTVFPDRTSILRYHMANVNHGLLGRMSWYRHELAQLDIREWGPYVLDKYRKAWSRAKSGSQSSRYEEGGELDLGSDVRIGGGSYAKALLRFKPQPFEGVVTLLISEEMYPKNRVQPWAELATNGAELHIVPGNHETYIREHAAALAECLSACLKNAQA
jgi:hypothetical protein